MFSRIKHYHQNKVDGFCVAAAGNGEEDDNDDDVCYTLQANAPLHNVFYSTLCEFAAACSGFQQTYTKASFAIIYNDDDDDTGSCVLL